jgi:FkbM family methyltransferase
MYDEIFVRQVYRQYGITIADDACIIDAGANIGLFSLFAAAARPQARIFAVEPAAPATDVLTVNVAVNGYRNIAVRNVGFSDRRENATLTFYAHSVGLTSVHASPDGEAAQLTSIITGQFRRGDIDGHDELRDFTADLVEAKLAPQTLPCLLVRLSDFMAAEGIERVDLLKIDVQKSELQLLNGINDEDWPRIRQVVLELQDIGGVVNEAVALLTRLGYSVRIAQDTVFAGSDMYYLYARRALETAAIAEPDRTSVIPPPPPLQTVTPAQLLSFLGHRVTAAQRPTDLRILPDLPRTVSGKVDRASITQDLRHSAAHPAPPTEPSGDRYLTDVAAVWSEVLGKPVQGTDDFFDVGGNSLSAARVITRIRQRYIGDIPIRWIFEASRLQDFADRLRALEPAPEAPTTQ